MTQKNAPLPLSLPPALNIAISLILAALFVVANAIPNWNGWAVDFSSIYYAGYFFGTGEWDQIFAAPSQVIGPDIPPRWAAAVAAMGHEGEQTYPFIYPPWVAAAMAPVTIVIGPQDAMNGLLILNCILMMACAALAFRVMQPLPMQLWVWMAVSTAILFTALGALLALALGQTQLIVFVLCLLAFERLKAGAPVAAGVALAFAAMLKLTPLFLVLIFVWNRDWRAFFAFGITCAVFTAGALGLIGWELHATYLDRLHTISEHLYLIHFAQSGEAWLYQVWDWWLGTAPPIGDYGETYYLKPRWIDIACKIGLVLAIAATWAATRNTTGPHRMPRQLLALSLAIPIFAPLGWAHYYLLAIYLMPGLVALMPTRPAVLILVIVGLSQVTPIRMPLNELSHFMFLDIILAVPIYLALFLAVLISGPVSLRRPATSPAKTPETTHPNAVPAE